jgi:hypothetical protein
MKINRLQLIGLVNDEITRREKKAAEWNAKRLEHRTAAQLTYRTETEDAWERFAQRILRRIENGDVVTADDRPAELRGWSTESVRFWREETLNWNQPITANVGDLVHLRRVLEASADDEVSTYALQKQGFSLGRVFGKEA